MPFDTFPNGIRNAGIQIRNDKSNQIIFRFDLNVWEFQIESLICGYDLKICKLKHMRTNTNIHMKAIRTHIIFHEYAKNKGMRPRVIF